MLEKHAIVIRLNFAKTHEKLLAQNSQIFYNKKKMIESVVIFKDSS